MRLGTCIALEFAVAASAVSGVWLGTGRLAAHAGDYLETRAVASPLPLARLAPEALPRPELTVIPPAALLNNVFGAPDEELLAPLGDGKITKMKLNHGGTSLSIRVDFSNGSRIAFKPEQIHPQSDPRREIAAYRIDRLLGLGRVPPAKEIELSVAELIDAGDQGFRAYYAGRLTDEGIARNGKFRGVASWWIPEIKLATLGPYRIDEREGRDIWTSQLQIGAKMQLELRPMLAQISACILFDLLIDNSDRWSGSNTEMSPDGKLLYFMDNTLAFSKATFGHEINVLAMRRIQIYPRGLVDKLRKLTIEQVDAAMTMPAESKLGVLIKPFEAKALIARRDNMLKWIDQLIARYGEQAVLAFP